MLLVGLQVVSSPLMEDILCNDVKIIMQKACEAAPSTMAAVIGMAEFVECGPGQVLTGLIGRIQKSI